MVFDLNKHFKLQYIALFTIVLFIVMLSSRSLQNDNSNQFDTQIVPSSDNYEKTTSTLISSKISSTNVETAKGKPAEGVLDTEAINPTQILRGNTFVASGQLIDTSTGQGLSGEPIEIFWSYFSWSAYETDRTGLRNDYLVGEGTTGANGYFTINCRDTDHSKRTGVVTVYTVFRGDPDLGPIINNRNYTFDVVECYATIEIGLSSSTNLIRDNHSFYAETLIGFDNYTAIPGIDGYTITLDWIGTQNLTTIVFGGYTNTTLHVPLGYPIGTYSLDVSFNMSQLGLSYTVGNINDEALIGTAAADWVNASDSITIFTGAGITVTIDDPVPVIPGGNPVVVKGITSVTVSGTITNSTGGSFNDDTIILEVFVHTGTTESSSYREATTNPDLDGDYSVTFFVDNSAITYGDHNVWVNVATGQGITAVTEYEQITIFGNTSISNPEVDGNDIYLDTTRVMPGETVQISGTILDAYDSDPVVGMTINAFWDALGVIYSDTTTAAGTFTIDLPVSITFDETVSEEDITVVATGTTYYNSTNVGFTVEIFTDVVFDVQIEETDIVEDSTIDTIAGEPIYYNSTFTISGTLVDQFDRPVIDRNINYTIESIGTVIRPINDGVFTYTFTGDESISTTSPYTVTITFNENDDFSFQISFQDYPTPTPTSPTDSSTNTGTPPGENNWMDILLIVLMIGIVSGIIIVSVVYAFGRFKRAQKRPKTSSDVELPGLDVILKQIDESEQAKDFKRAVILCYRAFEAICIASFGVIDARSQSPRELARIVAQTNRIPVRDVTMLVMRYEEARFSEHKIGKPTFTQARQALHNIQLSVEQPRQG